jgi:hypothetical protein
MKNIILIIGGLITVVLTVLWYFEIITEPVAAIGSAILTFLSYLFVGNDKSVKKVKKIKQIHYGDGDNVGGNKTTNN